MPIADKVAAAKKIAQLLNDIIAFGGFRWRFKITVDPPAGDSRDWERPDILVDLSGPDADLLLARNAELLRALENVAHQTLRLPSDEHEKVVFDSMNQRALRLEELRTAAQVAAERVRKSGAPYAFGPMNSRERRVLHL